MRRRRLRAALLAAVVITGAALLLVIRGDGETVATVSRKTRKSRGLRGPLSKIGFERPLEQISQILLTPATRTSSRDAQLTNVSLSLSPPAASNGYRTFLKPQSTETELYLSGSIPRPLNTGLEPASLSEEAKFASPLSGCQCRRRLPPGARRVASSCTGFASRRGSQQRVVSFSWFGPVNTAYFRGIAANAALLPRYYPGWVMRVYYRDPEKSLLPWLCPLVCRYPHLDLCEVSDGGRPGPPANEVKHGEGALWRFLPLADPSVERFVSRDLDSLIGQRESDAVQEWVKSGKTIHVMRDHPLHAVSVLAGAWGAWNHRNDVYRPLRERLVAITDTAAQELGEDQARLAEFVYGPAVVRGDVLEHDSYFCGVFGPSRPFPSRRYLGTYPHFIGDRVMLRDFERERRTPENWLYYIRKCPLECRPQMHMDWLWC